MPNPMRSMWGASGLAGILVCCTLMLSLNCFAQTQAPEARREIDDKLIAAIIDNRLDVVKALLAEGASATATDERGVPALSAAAMRGGTELLDLLISKGADVHAGVKGAIPSTRPIYAAVAQSNLPAVKFLLSKGATLKEAAPAFPFAVMNKGDAVTRFLLDEGVDPDIREPVIGNSALQNACAFGNKECVALLLARGAKVNQTDFLERTPLMLTLEGMEPGPKPDRLAIVRLLLAKGAKVNAKSLVGDTALKLAVKSKHKELIQILKQAGAKK